MGKMIETMHLTKRFRGFAAVRDVSLSVEHGEIYGFLGLNGAGKTTTIRMLLGLIRPSTGCARICGEPVGAGGRGPWARVGALVETPHAYPELTVWENLEVARRMRCIAERRASDRIADMLRLTAYRDKRAGELSLGNMQRLGLARAMIHQPDVLILDEPANGLDPAGIVEIRRYLIELATARGVTIFVSSHNLDEIARVATRIGVIHQGGLLTEMNAAEIDRLRRKRLLVGARDRQRAKEMLRREGFAVADGGGELLELTGQRALERPDTIAAILAAANNPPTALWKKEDSLEAVFMELIGTRGERDG
jgi:ABC-2 type transport system ATP-binding protein